MKTQKRVKDSGSSRNSSTMNGVTSCVRSAPCSDFSRILIEPLEDVSRVCRDPTDELHAGKWSVRTHQDSSSNPVKPEQTLLPGCDQLQGRFTFTLQNVQNNVSEVKRSLTAFRAFDRSNLTRRRTDGRTAAEPTGVPISQDVRGRK